MKLKTLKLVNWRNYPTLDFAFPPEPLVVLCGNNGQGKTNILESIYMLAITKSFGSQNKRDITTFGKNYSSLQCELDNGEEIQTQEIIWELHPKPRSVRKIRGVNKEGNEYIGNLLVVLFRPEDMDLVSGSPTIRRRYFNTLLCQIDPLYLSALATFQSTLKNRNALLERISDRVAKEDELEYWDMELARSGGIIYAARRETASRMRAVIADQYKKISKENRDLQLIWKREFSGKSTVAIEAYRKKLSETRSRDIAARMTLSGPHRDDFHLELGGRDLALFGSRGEQRTGVLALKLAEIQVLEEITGRSPILLLDDILSELDSDRQQAILSLARNHQTILTSATDLPELNDAKIYRVSRGTISG